MDELTMSSAPDPAHPSASGFPNGEVPTVPTIADPSARPPRRRLSRPLIVGVVLSAALAIGGFVLLSRAGQSHRRAVATRTTAAERLTSQETATRRSESHLAATRSDASTVEDPATHVLGIIQQLGQIDDQGTAASGAVVHAGENIGVSATAYNALVENSNRITDSWNSVEGQLDQQVGQLPTS
jgi:hypothetical protein